MLTDLDTDEIHNDAKLRYSALTRIDTKELRPAAYSGLAQQVTAGLEGKVDGNFIEPFKDDCSKTGTGRVGKLVGSVQATFSRGQVMARTHTRRHRRGLRRTNGQIESKCLRRQKWLPRLEKQGNVDTRKVLAKATGVQVLERCQTRTHRIANSFYSTFCSQAQFFIGSILRRYHLPRDNNP